MLLHKQTCTLLCRSSFVDLPGFTLAIIDVLQTRRAKIFTKPVDIETNHSLIITVFAMSAMRDIYYAVIHSSYTCISYRHLNLNRAPPLNK